MTTFEKIKALCNEKGFAVSNISEVIPDLDVSKSAVSLWKKGATPNIRYLQTIADYFNVPLSYLSDDNFGQIVSDRVIEKQKELGLTLAAIDRRMGNEYSSKLSSVLRGKSTFRQKEIECLAEILNTSADYLTGQTDDPKRRYKSEVTPLDGKELQFIPLYNSVSAGFGACAVDLVEDYIPVYALKPETAKNCIAIRVHGDSMQPKIEDGDVIVVHKQDSVDSGTIAVVFLDGDAAMVKRVVYDETHISLESLNPKYSPMTFPNAEVLRVTVVGKVIEIHKKLG